MHTGGAENSFHPKYRPDIDGLRAIAVLCVVAFHAFPSLLPGGFIGVDVFFVISGFLISGIILGNLERNDFSFSSFYGRRIKRIFPALLVVLLATYILGWNVLLVEEYQQLGKHIAGGAGFVSNLLLWRESGYFDNAAATKPLLHLWSLGVEEQFYVFWPLILWFAWKRRINLLLAMCVIGALSFGLNLIQTSANPTAAFYSPLTRFWELMLGAILAYISFHRRTEPVPIGGFSSRIVAVFGGAEKALPWLRASGAMVGAILIALGAVVIRESNFPGAWALLPALGSLLVIWAGAGAWLNRVVLANPVLVWIGLISYPLYLWHWPLLSIARIVQGEPTSLTRGALVLLSVVLAWLTTQIVEKPVRFGKGGALGVWALVVLMLTVGGTGLYTNLHNGLEARAVVQGNIRLDSGADGGWPKFGRSCEFLKSEERHLFTCAVDSRGEPRFAVLGDSKAGVLFQGLFRTSVEGGTWIYFGSGKSGPLLPVLSNNPIYNFYKKEPIQTAIKILGEKPNIHTVVISAASRAFFQLNNDYSIEDLPSSPNYAAALDGLDNAVSRLISYGKKVVLVVDKPTLPHMEDCIDRKTSSDTFNRLFLRPGNANCHLSIDKYRTLSKQYLDMLHEVQTRHPSEVRVFDATSILCDSLTSFCSPTKNGRLLYGVTDHISDYGSTLVGQALNQLLTSDVDARQAHLPPVQVHDWGSQQTIAGQGVNVQPDGTSALWIKAEDISRFGDVYAYFGAHRARRPAIVSDSTLTTGIPPFVINHAGDYEVAIDEASGRRTHVGIFKVRNNL